MSGGNSKDYSSTAFYSDFFFYSTFCMQNIAHAVGLKFGCIVFIPRNLYGEIYA